MSTPPVNASNSSFDSTPAAQTDNPPLPQPARQLPLMFQPANDPVFESNFIAQDWRLSTKKYASQKSISNNTSTALSTSTSTSITTTTASTAITTTSTSSEKIESSVLRLLRAARDNKLENLAPDAKQILASLSASARQILLVTAADQGSKNLVSLLLESPDFNINRVAGTGDNALHAACEQGHAEIVELLLKAGADPNFRNKNFHTPLILACKAGNLKSVELLADKLGDQVRSNIDVSGCSALLYAANAGHKNIVQYLLKIHLRLDDQAGIKAMLNAAVHNLPTAIIELHEAGISVNVKDDNGLTPLKTAASVYQFGAVFTLLKLDAKLLSVDFTGQNALEGLIFRFNLQKPDRRAADMMAMLIEGYNKPIPIDEQAYEKLKLIAKISETSRLKIAISNTKFQDHHGHLHHTQERHFF